MTVHARSNSSVTKSSTSSPRTSDTPVDIEKQQSKRHSSRHARGNSSGSEASNGNGSGNGNGNGSGLLSSAASYKSMLGGGGLRRRVGLGLPRVPGRVMRLLCSTLFVALLLFALVWFRSAASDSGPFPVQVQPKPPQWEKFPFLQRYHGGIRNLVPRNENVPEYPGRDSGEEGVAGGSSFETRNQHANMLSAPFDPYPAYASEEYIEKYGEKRECFLDDENEVRLPLVHHYPGVPRGFPDAIMGSNEMMGIRDDVCFDRFGRLGPYGFGYGIRKGGVGVGLDGEREGAERVWEDIPPVDFGKVDWGAAQNRTGSERLPRTAVVIRTWHDFRYTPEDILYLRSLISELSLLSGGEYVVHILVHLKNENLPVWTDKKVYERVLNDSLPVEFRGLATFWSERQMQQIYPDLEETWTRGLPIHGVYRSTFMSMQYFAQIHPEYDYYWNWEMDARNTGHWYHLFDKLTSWAREQPRKGLWERNARFYVPSVHGSWEQFRQTVRWQTQTGTNSPNNIWLPTNPDQDQQQATPKPYERGDKFIWGPVRPEEPDIFEVDGEGNPPTTIERDQYDWGVGEEPDLIAFNPLYDPEGTTWILRDDVTGYTRTKPSNTLPPRRTSIITASRLSRKLLHTMHRETRLKKHSMFSEMWPATTALHHGFKAVFVPHSVYVDRRWPPRYLESVFNAGRNGAAGGARTAVFGEREHNFRGTTWFYSAGFSPDLWRRWLGIKVDGVGGELFELSGEGRLCLPPMLLHPVKDVGFIVDSNVPVQG